MRTDLRSHPPVRNPIIALIDLIRRCPLAVFLVFGFSPLSHSQTIEDGIMLSKGTICTGFLYTHDAWDHYWEGELNRTNGNLGTVKTQTIDYTANYGVFSRLNVIGSLPYVWTHASQGVLHGQSGFQDITLAAKYRLLNGYVG